jgi:hypothetical protein
VTKDKPTVSTVGCRMPFPLPLRAIRGAAGRTEWQVAGWIGDQVAVQAISRIAAPSPVPVAIRADCRVAVRAPRTVTARAISPAATQPALGATPRAVWGLAPGRMWYSTCLVDLSPGRENYPSANPSALE